MVQKMSAGQARVADWNELHPAGTPVVVTNDAGQPMHTKTRSEAWMLGADSRSPGHTPVVLLEGISGAYALERCRALRVVDVQRTSEQDRMAGPGGCGDGMG